MHFHRMLIKMGNMDITIIKCANDDRNIVCMMWSAAENVCWKKWKLLHINVCFCRLCYTEVRAGERVKWYGEV